VEDGEKQRALEQMEAALGHQGEEKYVLRLYVAGTTPRSARAIANMKRICEKDLKCYDLEVIDVYQQPDVVNRDEVIAVPTLIKVLPSPLRKLIGDLSDREKVLVGLGLAPGESDEDDE